MSCISYVTSKTLRNHRYHLSAFIYKTNGIRAALFRHITLSDSKLVYSFAISDAVDPDYYETLLLHCYSRAIFLLDNNE